MVVADNQPEQRTHGFGRHPFWAMLLSGALIWIALPPAGLWPVVWIALIPLVSLVASRQLAERYKRKLWLASWLFCAAWVYWVPYAHPLLWLGWLALSFYLSWYPWLAVGLARELVHRYRCPVVLALPIVWTSLDYMRAHLLTGFGMMQLGHALFRHPLLIQVADLSGGYLVTFVVVLVNGLLWRIGRCLIDSRRNRSNDRYTGTRGVLAPCSALVVLFVVVLGYGGYRLQQRLPESEPAQRAAAVQAVILQGAVDTVFPKTPEEDRQRQQHLVNEYRALASAAELWEPGSQPGSKPQPKYALQIWPEGKFPAADMFVESAGEAAAHPRSPNLREELELSKRNFRYVFDAMQRVQSPDARPGEVRIYPRAIPAIVGTQSFTPAGDVFNSALSVDSEGNVQQRYLKMHRVMFGEYIPFQEMFPVLQKILPSGKGLTAGSQPVNLQYGGLNFCPSICYESTLPHLVRRQVNELDQRGDEPDVLLNLTDDGWFYGASILDFHLASNVFRAIELRKPMLVAANTGLSAHIDGNGTILKEGPRRQVARIAVQVTPDGRTSWYRLLGDWPVFILSLIPAGVAVRWLMGRLFTRRRSRTESPDSAVPDTTVSKREMND